MKFRFEIQGSRGCENAAENLGKDANAVPSVDLICVKILRNCSSADRRLNLDFQQTATAQDRQPDRFVDRKAGQ